MPDITLDGLPAKTGTIDDAAVLHLKEAGVDKKLTIATLLTKISSVYSSFVNSFLTSTTPFEARNVLEIDRRTAVNNANYTILNTDRVVSQTGIMSAVRTFTLPAANTFRAGGELIISDDSGTVTSVNKIIILRAGADTIDGATIVEIGSAYGFIKLISNGTNGWKVQDYKIASQAETNAITNDISIVTPLKLGFGFAVQYGTNGYIKLPSWLGSFIMQWGAAISEDGAGALVTFPIPFPTAVRGIHGTARQDVINTNSHEIFITNENQNNFLFRNSRADRSSFWFAYGN